MYGELAILYRLINPTAHIFLRYVHSGGTKVELEKLRSRDNF